MPLHNPPTNAIPGTRPIVADPPTDATIAQLRSTIVELLNALRDRAVLAPNLPSTARNPALLNPLTYTPINNGSYSYHNSAYTMTALNDGSNTNGMMATTAKAFVQLQLPSSAFLNRIQLSSGQFNGGFNIPRKLRIYAGAVTTDTATPLIDQTLSASTALQTINLSSLVAFDNPSNIFTFVFSASTDFHISVAELLLFGQLI